MSAQLYILIGVALVLLAGYFGYRKNEPMTIVCAFVGINLIVCGPVISTLP